MAFVTASGQLLFENAGNLQLLNSGPNARRPLISGNDTIMRWLHNQPEFSNFLSLIYTAGLSADYDNLINNKTLFVPSNEVLEKHKNLLCNMSRSKARAIVKFHSIEIPMSHKNIQGTLFETRNSSGINMLIDGRVLPFRAGYSEIGPAFGISWIAVANMANVEYITKNGIIIPIDDIIFPDVEMLG